MDEWMSHIVVGTGCILRIDFDPQSLHSSLLLEPSIWEAHKTPRQGVDNVRVVGERRYRGSRLITLGEIYLIQMVPKPSLGTVPYFLRMIVALNFMISSNGLRGVGWCYSGGK